MLHGDAHGGAESGAESGARGRADAAEAAEAVVRLERDPSLRAWRTQNCPAVNPHRGKNDWSETCRVVRTSRNSSRLCFTRSRWIVALIAWLRINVARGPHLTSRIPSPAVKSAVAAEGTAVAMGSAGGADFRA